MYESLIKFLENYKASELVIFIVALISGIAYLFTKLATMYKKVSEFFRQYFKREEEYQDNLNQLHANTAEIERLKQAYKEADEMIKQNSDERDREILDAINNLASSVQSLSDNFEEYKQKQEKKEEEEKEIEVEDLRGRLIDKYNQYKERGSITDMELQNVSKLFERYEKLNGNSYVHSHIKPFILALPVVNEIGNDHNHDYKKVGDDDE